MLPVSIFQNIICVQFLFKFRSELVSYIPQPGGPLALPLGSVACGRHRSCWSTAKTWISQGYWDLLISQNECNLWSIGVACVGGQSTQVLKVCEEFGVVFGLVVQAGRRMSNWRQTPPLNWLNCLILPQVGKWLSWRFIYIILELRFFS